MKYALVAGRILFSLIFILSSFGHFKAETIGFAASKGVPLASVLVPLSGIIELIAGVAIMIGYRVRIAAWLLIVFMVPVTLTFHQFWTVTDPMAFQLEFAMFLKNVSIMGGALILAYFGAGELSVDAAGKRQPYTMASGKQATA